MPATSPHDEEILDRLIDDPVDRLDPDVIDIVRRSYGYARLALSLALDDLGRDLRRAFLGQFQRKD